MEDGAFRLFGGVHPQLLKLFLTLIKKKKSGRSQVNEKDCRRDPHKQSRGQRRWCHPFLKMPLCHWSYPSK